VVFAHFLETKFKRGGAVLDVRCGTLKENKDVLVLHPVDWRESSVRIPIKQLPRYGHVLVFDEGSSFSITKFQFHLEAMMPSKLLVMEVARRIVYDVQVIMFP